MAAPTFVTSQPGASWDTTTSPKTSGALATNLGDLVVSILGDENDDGNENYTWTSSVAETWTENTETPGTTNSDTFLQSARAVTTSDWAAGTVSATRTAGTVNRFNHIATVWRNHGGVDHVENSGVLATTSPSYSFTAVGTNSALLMIAADWAARTNAARGYTAINGISGIELAYFNNTAAYTVVAAYWPDVGAPGAKTVQVTGFANAVDMRMHVVEIRGTGGAAASSLLVPPARRLLPILAR